VKTGAEKAEFYLRAEIKYHFRLYCEEVYFESLERPGKVYALIFMVAPGIDNIKFFIFPTNAHKLH